MGAGLRAEVQGMQHEGYQVNTEANHVCTLEAAFTETTLALRATKHLLLHVSSTPTLPPPPSPTSRHVQTVDTVPCSCMQQGPPSENPSDSSRFR